MLTNLGRPAIPADAVELLLECHVRIRFFLDLTSRLAASRDLPPEEVAAAAARVHRYFTQALPLHARDEEESLLPRLRGRDPAVDDELQIMCREHAEHARPLERLTGHCAALAAEPGRLGELAPAVGLAGSLLARHFAVHLDREERLILPAARRLLTPDEDARLVAEMRARRAPARASAPPGKGLERP